MPEKHIITLNKLSLICNAMENSIFSNMDKRMELTKNNIKTFSKIQYIINITTYQTSEKLNQFSWQLFLIFLKVAKNYKKGHFYLIESLFEDIGFKLFTKV